MRTCKCTSVSPGLLAMTGLQRSAMTTLLLLSNDRLTPLSALRSLSGSVLVVTLVRVSVNPSFGLQLRITRLRMFKMLGQSTTPLWTRPISPGLGVRFKSGSIALRTSLKLS